MSIPPNSSSMMVIELLGWASKMSSPSTSIPQLIEGGGIDEVSLPLVPITVPTYDLPEPVNNTLLLWFRTSSTCVTVVPMLATIRSGGSRKSIVLLPPPVAVMSIGSTDRGRSSCNRPIDDVERFDRRLVDVPVVARRADDGADVGVVRPDE